MAIDAKFIVNLQGKDFPLYAGILGEAHERGLASIETALVQIPSDENAQTSLVKAIVTMKDGSRFEDYGDSNPRNTGAKVATALIRMASTRAKGRALRDAINVGQTLFEELPDLDEERSAPARQGNRRDTTPSRYGREADEAVTAAAERGRERMAQGPQTGAPLVCSEEGCGTVLNQAVAAYSQQHYKRPLCRDHQPQRVRA